jgi:hypothetical protein
LPPRREMRHTGVAPMTDEQAHPAWRQHLEGGAELIEDALPFYTDLLESLERRRPGELDERQRHLSERLAASDTEVGAAIDRVDLALARGELPVADPLVARKEQLAKARQRLAQLAVGLGGLTTDLQVALRHLDTTPSTALPAAQEPEGTSWQFESVDAAALAHAGAEVASMDARPYKKVEWPQHFHFIWHPSLGFALGGLVAFGVTSVLLPRLFHGGPSPTTFSSPWVLFWLFFWQHSRARRVLRLSVFEGGIGFEVNGRTRFEPWSRVLKVSRDKGLIRLARGWLQLPNMGSAQDILETIENRLADARRA